MKRMNSDIVELPFWSAALVHYAIHQEGGWNIPRHTCSIEKKQHIGINKRDIFLFAALLLLLLSCESILLSKQQNVFRYMKEITDYNELMMAQILNVSVVYIREYCII